MNEREAFEHASRFLLLTRNLQSNPIGVRLIRTPTRRQRYWLILYGQALLFPAETAAGTVIDGGEYLLKVVDKTGQVLEVPSPG